MIKLKINEAVTSRILELCSKYNLTINGLANRCMLTQSTVDHIVSGSSENPKLLTIVRICAGLNITIVEFFNSPVFDNIETEL